MSTMESRAVGWTGRCGAAPCSGVEWCDEAWSGGGGGGGVDDGGGRLGGDGDSNGDGNGDGDGDGDDGGGDGDGLSRCSAGGCVAADGLRLECVICDNGRKYSQACPACMVARLVLQVKAGETPAMEQADGEMQMDDAGGVVGVVL